MQIANKLFSTRDSTEKSRTEKRIHTENPFSFEKTELC